MHTLITVSSPLGWPRFLVTAGIRSLVVGMVVALSGCSLSRLVDVDPLSVGSAVSAKDARTITSAILMYNNTVGAFAQAWSSYVWRTGGWTDELACTGCTFANDELAFDSRSSAPGSLFRDLTPVTGGAQLAIDALSQHSGQKVHEMLTEVYALRAFTILSMAEAYCSGVPLPSVTIDGHIKWSSGLSTEDLLRYSIAVFDTALQYQSDSIPLLTLIRVGRGRAYINLGEWQNARDAVADVEPQDRYLAYYVPTVTALRHWTQETQARNWKPLDAEGGNGMIWKTSPQDPRVPIDATGNQTKFVTGTTSAIVADGIEAGLIRAEAQLHDQEGESLQWLQTLNALRAQVVTSTGVRQLPDLTDPGNFAARVTMLFNERAFWLYLTGHRQGDLRRLIRQYGRPLETVYPLGEYHNQSRPLYEENVVMPIDPVFGNEEVYRGCFDTNP